MVSDTGGVSHPFRSDHFARTHRRTSVAVDVLSSLSESEITAAQAGDEPERVPQGRFDRTSPCASAQGNSGRRQHDAAARLNRDDAGRGNSGG